MLYSKCILKNITISFQGKSIYLPYNNALEDFHNESKLNMERELQTKLEEFCLRM